MSCGADTTANALMTALLQGKSFDLPDVDLDGPEYEIPDGSGYLYDPPARITNEELTERRVDGNGVFDALMAGIAAHLKKEFDTNRITGEQYTKAFIGAAGAAMGNATQFLLGRDQAYWQAITAQLQARSLELGVVTARVQLQTAKAQLAIARTQALTVEAEYALTKLKLATEDQQYCLLKIQTEQGEFTLAQLMPLQKAQLEDQNEGLILDNDAKEFSNTNILPVQRDLLKEQVEVQRAQTLDERTDGATIEGSVGKQKDLYDQQITSYKRDAEVKAVKMFVDGWITQKTIDEGLDPPGAMANPSLNIMLKNIKKLNGLSDPTDDQYGTWNETKEAEKGYAKPEDVPTP